MKLSTFLLPLSIFARHCIAGPLIAVIADVAVAAIEGAEVGGVDYAAATAAEWKNIILGSRIGQAFGYGIGGCWFDDFVIVNGDLWVASGVAGGAGVVAAGGAAGAGVAGADGAKFGATHSVEGSVLLSMIRSVSIQSALDVVNQIETVLANVKSHKSLSSILAISETSALASVESQMNAPQVHDTKKDPFTFAKGTGIAMTTPAPTSQPEPVGAGTTSVPPPPGTPVSSVPTSQRSAEVPAGVPEYNWRMCQYDMIKMGQNKQNFIISQPTGAAQSLVVANIPSTCMVLSSFLVGNPALGPHPVVVGADKLQWNNIDPDTITLIRQTFGAEAVNATFWKETLKQ